MTFAIESDDNPIMRVQANALVDAIAQFKVEGPPTSGVVRVQNEDTGADFVVMLNDGPICELCGCTEHNPCLTAGPDRVMQPCHWTSKDPYICSACRRVAA